MAGHLCRGCRRSALDTVVDLGDVAASDAFPRLDDPVPDPAWPLTLALCTACCLVQLGPTDTQAPEPPMAVESTTSMAHAVASAQDVMTIERLHAGDSFIEIDSHHGGSWRDEFARLGLREVTPDGTADLVVDVHGLPHEPDAWTLLAQHAARVNPGGRLVLEFHHLLPLVEQSQIDTIRHGHWVYLSALALDSLLGDHGLRLTRAVQTPAFGGSLRLTAMRLSDRPAVDASVHDILATERAAGLADVTALRRLGQQGRKRAAALRQHLEEAASERRRIAGYGAPSKAAVLLALAEVDQTLLPYTVDLAPAKHGCRIPGVGVPILPVETLADRRPDEVVVLTWDIADEIVAQLSSLSLHWDPAIYVPMPEPRVLDLGRRPRWDAHLSRHQAYGVSQ